MGKSNVQILNMLKMLAKAYVDMLTWRESFRWNLEGEQDE